METDIYKANNYARPIPERLKEARLARGLSISQLASVLQVTRQAISRYEQGDLNPKAETIRQMSTALNFPLSFFAKQVIPDDKINGTTYFRSLLSTDENIRNMIKVRNKWTCEVFSEYEKFLKFPQVDIPNYDDCLNDNILILDDIEKITLNLRSHWGLGVGPISNIALLLEKKGCILSAAETGQEKADACSQKIGSRPFIFLGEDKKSAARTRFNMVHELGHCILHPDITEDDLKNRVLLRRVEKEANMFASSFLLPRDSFTNEVMSLSLQHFITLKQRWKVSIAAMVYRCHELNIITDGQALNLRKQISMKKWNRHEPLDDELHIELPSLLNKATSMIVEKGIRSPFDLVDTFCLPVRDLESVCGLSQDSLLPDNRVIKIDFKSKDNALQ